MLDAILGRYAWFDHPEGMKFAETYRDSFRTVGHWLFLPGSFSAFHQVMNCEEIWTIHVGRLTIHVIDAAGEYSRHELGQRVDQGEIPLITIAPGAWQAAELPNGVEFAFGANVCAPAFDYSQMRIGKRDELLALFPARAELIRRLSHEQG